jgi:S-adenosylmethionine:tRNA ribosyltransferase-isomerase
MKTADFDYSLPAELIAQQPLADRTASRMMVVDRGSGEIWHDQFRNIGTRLLPGDLLVLNDTKVIPARIWSVVPRTEVLLVEKLGPDRWSALVKPAKRAEPGATLHFPISPYDVTIVTTKEQIGTARLLEARVEAATDFGGRILRFAGDVEGYMEKFGAAPLPPYIKRPRVVAAGVDHGQPPSARAATTATDRERYQTVYARQPGAIAAPTAGLHFTRSVLDGLRKAGIDHTFITLHVGIGTFRPVKTEMIEQHRMHAEKFAISPEAAQAMRSAKRIVAVGTTVVRALESVGEFHACEGMTDIYIHPPFKFRVVDAMLTNFHLPKSTLLMLVCAFASRELILRAYAEAVKERYRFYSYGDCMLIS